MHYCLNSGFLPRLSSRASLVHISQICSSMRATRSSTRLGAKVEQDGQGKSFHTTVQTASLIVTQEPEPSEGTREVPARPAAPRKRKVKVLDESESLERIKSCPWKVGAHVSSAGGVENAVLNAASIGANAFALFLKSQRKWHGPPLSESSISLFKERMKEYDYTPSVVLPHGSYLINLGNPDLAKRKKSYECFIDDLQRCEQLGLELYNFHPGSTVGLISTKDCISLIAECINNAHKETNYVTIVIENMAGAGNVIGSDFADLGGIIAQVEDKTRVGVCLDTCHMFAAGYDIRTKEGWNAMLTEFDEKVGLEFLRGMHLNDSKTDLGSKKDRHENIGSGFLGIKTFLHILRDPRVQKIPLILETPSFEKPKEVWGKEIQVLQRLAVTGTDKLSALEEGELADSVREAVKLVGGSKTNKKPRTAKTSVNGKVLGRRKKVDDESECGSEQGESEED